MKNNKNKKIFNKTIVIFLIVVMIFTTSFGPAVRISRAEDSPEEIAREQEEAQREAERKAQKEADRAAEAKQEEEEERQEDLLDAQRKAEHDAAKAQRDQQNVPSPTATPTTVPTVSPDVVAENTNTGANSQNDATATSETNADIDVENSGSLDQTLTTVSNSGNNTSSGDTPPPSSTPQPTQAPKDPLPQCGDNQKVDNNPVDQQDDHTVDNTTGSLDGSQDGGGGGSEASDTSTNATTLSPDNGQPTSDGDSDSTDTIITNNDEVTISNNHCANIANDEEISAVSGNNSQVGNEDATVLGTGDAQATDVLQNQGNTNEVEVDRVKKAENTDTEDGSSNDTTVDNTTNLTVDNNNEIYADNQLNANAVSGGNESIDNEDNTRVSTGDIDILINLLNILNMNITGTDFTHLIVNIFHDLNGEVNLNNIADQLGLDKEDIEIIARNSRTGKNSHNDAEINNDLNLTVNNDNNATVRNDVNVAGVSGTNDVSKNEDKVDLKTGRIKILVAIMNFINANFSGSDWYFAMINIFGNLRGDILLPDADGFLVGDKEVSAVNSDTGADSANDATVTDKSSISASDSNSAAVTNNVTAVGDSGSNNAYANGDKAKSQTGDVNVLNRALNWLNTNIVGDHWVLLIVNVLGRWMGHVVAFPGKGNIDAPEEGILVAAAGSGTRDGSSIGAENSETGDGSTNDATVNNTNNWQVDNTNQAQVENNVNVAGISGQNTTNENDDGLSVSTGWIDITSGLLNVVNFNVTGRDWLMVMVNVFGDFWGNIVFPNGEEPQTALADVGSQDSVSATDDFSDQSGEQALGGVNSSNNGNDRQGQETAFDNQDGGLTVISQDKKGQITPTPVYLPTYTSDESVSEDSTNNEDDNFKEPQVFVYTSDNNPPSTFDGTLSVLGISGMNLPIADFQTALALLILVLLFSFRTVPFRFYQRKENGKEVKS